MKAIITVGWALLSFTSSHNTGIGQVMSVTLAEIEVPARSTSLAITLNFTLKSNAEESILLYGVHSRPNFSIAQEALCDAEQVGVGLCLMIFDNENKRMYFVPAIREPSEPMTSERFINEMSRLKNEFLQGTEVLIHGEELKVATQVDLTEAHLKPGIYSLQLVYYAGKGLYDNFVVGTEIVRKDEKEKNAVAFQGCSFSNNVVLNVK